ncbi:hypothetical protein QLX08_005987 [Tetragonisca angustula]|uniref:Uncharacterized protein n=1 Tax=Tetragonisca angustula TaxID=166442 RepID=A0AAW0ZXT5_9HYME
MREEFVTRLRRTGRQVTRDSPDANPRLLYKKNEDREFELILPAITVVGKLSTYSPSDEESYLVDISLKSREISREYSRTASAMCCFHPPIGRRHLDRVLTGLCPIG